MSVSGITFSGLASGLDTQAIIQALLAVEQRPIQALEIKKQSFQRQASLFGDLGTKLDALRDAADELRKSSGFLEFAASVDTEAYLTASAGTGAVAGTYNIVVGALAASQSVKSEAYASGSDPELAGSNGSKLTFTIDGQTTFDVDLTSPTYSLDDVAAAINGAGQGISAQVVQVSAGDYRLVLNGEVGADKSFTVSGTGTASVVALANGLSDPSNSLQTASDSQVTINGLEITRSSNTISDAITGVTLNLAAVSGPVSTQLTVNPDATATGDKVQKLVDAYNSIVDFMESQSQVDEEGNTSSPLFGDSTLRSIRSSLRNVLGSQATTGSLAYSLLSQIGIEADRTGRLTFDRGEFEQAVAADETAVVELFSNATDGIATRLHALTDDYLDTVDGLLVTRKNGFNTRIKDTEDQIEKAERRLEQMQLSLERRYADLEVLLGQLQSQGAALGGLPAPNVSR